MLFNSIGFLLFFSIVIPLYFFIPYKYRWILLLVSSYFFYMAWKPQFIILILITTTVSYLASILIEKYDRKAIKKLLLVLSLTVNLGLLIYFKYFNLFIESLNEIAGTNFNILKIILPMGISFYTFQTISYTIDVYWGKLKAEKHFGYFALYVTYFPQLVAGPIERADRLLPQLKQKHDFDYTRTVDGLQRMAWGFFKKIVIADNIAILVNKVFSAPANYNGFVLLIATVLFAIQIYTDFSGYCDIAIGASNIMGIDLMENFKRPYMAGSLKDFWKRWHISLSTWFRDYVYKPLGGSRISLARTYVNVMAVFLISGLWHGASWHFVIWGGIHAVFQLLENVLAPFSNRVWRALKLEGSKVQSFFGWLVTMIIVMCAWIFFRANNAEEAVYILKTILHDCTTWNFPRELLSSLTMIRREILLNVRFCVIGCSVLMLIVNDIVEEYRQTNWFGIFEHARCARWLMRYIVVFSILLFGAFGQVEFIYFQF